MNSKSWIAEVVAFSNSFSTHINIHRGNINGAGVMPIVGKAGRMVNLGGGFSNRNRLEMTWRTAIGERRLGGWTKSSNWECDRARVG